jgi:hypothetical protein
VIISSESKRGGWLGGKSDGYPHSTEALRRKVTAWSVASICAVIVRKRASEFPNSRQRTSSDDEAAS